MKKYALFISFSILCLAFTSCKDKTKGEQNNEPIEPTLSIGNSKISEPEIDKYVQEIENTPEANFSVANSLHYTNDVEDEQVKVFLKNDSIPVKLVENFKDLPHNILGRRIYYMKNDELLFVREIRQEPTPDSVGQMREIISYYKNGGVDKSAERLAVYEEDLDEIAFSNCTKTDMPFNNMIKMLDREDRYTTNFLGFINAGAFQFLWIGENDQEGLTTTLLLSEKDQMVEKLLANPNKYKGKHLDIDFELSNIQGITYQVYRGAIFSN